MAGKFVHDAVVEGEVHREADGEGDDDALEDVELPAQDDQGGDGDQDDQEHRQYGQQAQAQAPGGHEQSHQARHHRHADCSEGAVQQTLLQVIELCETSRETEFEFQNCNGMSFSLNRVTRLA